MKNKIKYLPIGILTLTTAVSGAALTATHAYADTSASSQASVTVATACAFTSAAAVSIPLSTPPGTYTNTEGSGTRNITITCNTSNALKIQAVGVAPHSGSPSTAEQGYNALYYAAEDASIPSNTPAAAGSNSYWAFKITSASASTNATITNNASSYSIVPTTPTDVVTFAAAATPASVTTATLRTDYQVQVASTQAAGAYTGGVKYLIVDGA